MHDLCKNAVKQTIAMIEILKLEVSTISNAAVQITFNHPVSYWNISCDFTSDQAATWFNVPKSGRQVVRYTCKENYHNVLKVASSCATKSGADGELLLRKWNSECLSHPKNISRICLVERNALLGESKIVTVGDFLSGPIDCNACTRLAMSNYLDTIDYLKGNPTYVANMSTLTVTGGQSGMANIKDRCGKPYDQLELETESVTASDQSGLPTWGIIVIIFAGLLILVFILFSVFKRRKREKKLSVPQMSSSNDVLLPRDDHLDSNYDDLRVTTMQ